MGSRLNLQQRRSSYSIRPLILTVNGPVEQQPLFHKWEEGFSASRRYPLAVVGRLSSVVRYGMLRFTKTIGFTQRPFTRISQCRCGPFVSPVSPDLPTIVPMFTQSPTFTSIALMWK